jgi:aconitate hydratase
VIAPRYLGLRVVIAKSFARIHWQNLANFGILALQFDDPGDYDSIEQGDVLRLDGLRDQLSAGKPVTASHDDRDLHLTHQLSERQVEMVLAGGRIPLASRHRGS